MKPAIIIAVAVVAVAIIAIALLAVFGTAPSGMATLQPGNEIVLSAIDRTTAVTEYTLDYNITNFVEMSGQSLEMPGTMKIEHSQSGERISITMQAQSDDVSVDIYKLADGVYNCQTGIYGAYCELYNDTPPVQNPIEQAEALIALAEDGAVQIYSLGQFTALKQCNAVSMSYDIAKLFAGASLPADAASGITEMRTSICFDIETGLPLEYEQTVSLDAETAVASRMVLSATRLELTASEIALPEDALIY